MDPKLYSDILDTLYPTGQQTKQKAQTKPKTTSLTHIAFDFIGSTGTAIAMRTAGKHLATRLIAGLALAPETAGTSLLLTGLSLLAEVGGLVLWDAIVNKKDPASVAIDWGGFLTGMEIGGKLTDKLLLKKFAIRPVVKTTIKNLSENLSGWAMAKSLNRALGHQDSDISPVVMAGFALVPAGLHATGKIIGKIAKHPHIENLIDKTYLKLTGMPKPVYQKWVDFAHEFFGKRQFAEYDAMLIDKQMKKFIEENSGTVNTINKILYKWVPLTIKKEEELHLIPDIVNMTSPDIKAMHLTQIGLHRLYEKIGLYERHPDLLNSLFVERMQGFIGRLTEDEKKLIDEVAEILSPLSKYVSEIEEMEKVLTPFRIKMIEQQIAKYKREIKKANEELEYFTKKMEEDFKKKTEELINRINEMKIQAPYYQEGWIILPAKQKDKFHIAFDEGELGQAIKDALQSEIEMLEYATGPKMYRIEPAEGPIEYAFAGSSFPEWFKKKGWTKEMAINAIQKALSGEPLGKRELEIVLSALNSPNVKNYVDSIIAWSGEELKKPELIKNELAKLYQKYQNEIKKKQTKTEAKIKRLEEKIKFLQEQAFTEEKALNFFYLTHTKFENPVRLEQLAKARSVSLGELEDLQKLSLEFTQPLRYKQYLKRRIFYTPLDRVFYTYQRTGKVIGLKQGYSYFNILLHRLMVGDYYRIIPEILELAERTWMVEDVVEKRIVPIASKQKLLLGSEALTVFNPVTGKIETYYLNHPEIKEMLNNFNSFLFGKDTGAMFFTGSEGPFLKISGLIKRLQVALGFVHHKALTTATLGVLGKDAKDVILQAYRNMLEGMGIEFLNKEPERFAFYERLMEEMEYVKKLAEKQKIKLPEILSKREFVNLTRLEEWEEKFVKGALGKGLLAEAYLKIQKLMSPFEKALWNYFFNTIKVETAKRILESNLPRDVKEKALKEIGSVVGGNIDWEVLKLTKTGQRTINWTRFLLFAPDWSLSMIRHITKTMEFPEFFGSFFSRILPLGYILTHHVAKAIGAPDPIDVFVATKNPIDLFSVYVYDAVRGKWKRFNLIGFEIEGLEFLGFLPALHALNHYFTFYNMQQAIDMAFSDWINVIMRKPSSILRFLEEFYYTYRGPHKEQHLKEIFETTIESVLPISLKELFRIALYDLLNLHHTDLASSNFLLNLIKSTNVYTSWDKRLLDGLGIWLLETAGLLRIYGIGENNKLLSYFLLVPKDEIYKPEIRRLLDTILRISYKRTKEGLISAWRPILRDLGLQEYIPENVEKLKNFAKGKVAEMYIWAGIEAMRRLDRENKRPLRRIKEYEQHNE